jgi:hypothetical protein
VKRREFIQTLSLTPAAALAQEGRPHADPVEKMTAGSGPTIGICHVGFQPAAKKRVVVRNLAARSCLLRDIGSGPAFHLEVPLSPVASDLDPAMTGDFTAVTREGMYQIRVSDELSPPFFIRRDAWRRLLPLVTSYHRAQRCGVAVPNVHPVCHLDDARRRDNGAHVDTTGGWHDAGDLRKWMSATMMNAFGLLALARHLGAGWDLAGSGLAPLEEELRWGNKYFLKMQNPADGRVWADVAGGVNGDNSDNHWTDNTVGTADDRYLNPSIQGQPQAMFTAMQAMYALHFRESDNAYSTTCLRAATNCWEANSQGSDVAELGWWLLAAIELRRADDAKRIAGSLAALQQPDGFWPISAANPEPYKNAVHGALPVFALLQAARAFRDAADANAWRSAVHRYIENYVVPLCDRSAYGIVPFGVFTGSPTPERYRPLSGQRTYRFFMPVRKQFWWLGLNAHLGSHALLLATAASEFNQPAWRDLAIRQFEWIFGNNPFGASLASGIGERNPYPHSRYVGVIPGGIMNGICGNADDEPILDTTFSGNWRTNEYWSPHLGYFEWAQAVLESS